MKKKNPLSIWSFPYRKRYYLLHPHKLIHDVYWNMRNFWHRGKYGYAYIDVWNFNNWFPQVGAEALRYLAANNNAYPGVKPWNSMESWREYLTYLANRLERCAHSMDIGFGEDRNEYKEQLDEIMEKRRKITHNNDGTVTHSFDLVPEEEEIRKKYWAREEEIRKADDDYNKKTWAWLAEDLPHLWD